MLEDIEVWLKTNFKKHPFTMAGGFIGITLGLLIMFFGFFGVLFLSLCTFIGIWLGRKMDSDEDLPSKLERFMANVRARIR